MPVLLAGWQGTAAIRRACLGKRRLLQEELSPGVETHVSSCREPEPEMETLTLSLCGDKLELILRDTHPDIQPVHTAKLELSLVPYVSIIRNESIESRLFRLNMDLDITVSGADGSTAG